MSRPTFEFDGDGKLVLVPPQGGGDGTPYEPVCGICNEEIRYCLDLFSFSTGFPHVLIHARCGWTPETFLREGAAAAGYRMVSE